MSVIGTTNNLKLPKRKKMKKKTELKKTNATVPTAPPQNVRAEPEDSSSVRVVWSPPPVDKQNGHISHYKLYYVEATRPDKEAIEMMLKSPLQGGTEFKLEELKKWTQYRIWLLAGTVVGDGPPSESITVRTQEDGTYFHFQTKEKKKRKKERTSPSMICLTKAEFTSRLFLFPPFFPYLY